MTYQEPDEPDDYEESPRVIITITANSEDKVCVEYEIIPALEPGMPLPPDARLSYAAAIRDLIDYANLMGKHPKQVVEMAKIAVSSMNAQKASQPATGGLMLPGDKGFNNAARR